jgi:predicted lipoprotein with Yx(FWY)xxD motif
MRTRYENDREAGPDDRIHCLSANALLFSEKTRWGTARNVGRLVQIALSTGILLLAGCGTGDPSGPGRSADSSAPAAAPAVGAQAGGQLVGSLVAAELPTLGAVVTDDHGWVLYRFDQDSAAPSAATCIGECATTWPPVLTDGAPGLDGVAADLVGSVVRPDSLRQVTLAGWPLYRYAGDRKPGQWRGQGKSKAWFAVRSSGKKNSQAATGPGG